MINVRLHLQSLLENAKADVQEAAGRDAQDNLDDIFHGWPAAEAERQGRWLSRNPGLTILPAWTGGAVAIPSITILIPDRSPSETGLAYDLGTVTRDVGETTPQRTGVVLGYKMEVRVRLWLNAKSPDELDTIHDFCLWALLRGIPNYLEPAGVENLRIEHSGDLEPTGDETGGQSACQAAIDLVCDVYQRYIQNGAPLTYGSVNPDGNCDDDD